MAEQTYEKVWSFLKKLGIHFLSPTDSLINWDMAAGYALDLSQAEETKVFEDREKLSGVYADLMDTFTPLIAAYFGQTGQINFSYPVCVFDRGEWIIVNLENLKSLLTPLSHKYWMALGDYLSQAYRPAKAFRKMSEMVLTAEMGLIVGHLAKRVLAQYDWNFPRKSEGFPGRLLYFVEPNIISLKEKLGLDLTSLRKWIALHEATHYFQFNQFAWIQNYLDSLWQEYLGLTDEAVSQIKSRVEEGMAPFSWSHYWWKQILSPAHLELIGKMQALMCLLEGSSDYIMFECGKELPHYQEILPVFKKRQAHKSWANRLLERFLGFEIKIQHYILGERFVSFVVREKGLSFFNQVWQGPENLPTWREIYYPNEWISRMSSRGNS